MSIIEDIYTNMEWFKKKQQENKKTYKFGNVDSNLPIIHSTQDQLILCLVAHLGEDFYKRLSEFDIHINSPMKEFIESYFAEDKLKEPKN